MRVIYIFKDLSWNLHYHNYSESIHPSPYHIHPFFLKRTKDGFIHWIPPSLSDPPTHVTNRKLNPKVQWELLWTRRLGQIPEKHHHFYLLWDSKPSLPITLKEVSPPPCQPWAVQSPQTSHEGSQTSDTLLWGSVNNHHCVLDTGLDNRYLMS